MEQISATGNVTTLVHFTYREDKHWRIACMPGMTELHATPHHPSYQRTNDTRACTCPACKRSDVFKQYSNPRAMLATDQSGNPGQ